YAEARTALRAWWAAAGDTATGDRRAAGLYLRAVLSDSLDAAERDLLRVSVEHPLAPDADDAVLRLAHVRLARRDSAGAASYLERLAADFPQSPHRAPALQQLARLRPAARTAASAPPNTPPASAQAPPPQSRELPREPAATGDPAARGETFTIQLASERSVARAAALRDRLRTAGFDAVVTMVGDDSTIRVRVGSFPSREAAAPTVARLRRAGYRPTVVAVGR
ncbi:MAG TPA: SPOR domain-containing protein, partial [Longimicrobiaceae bacterium]|nr:SPOR domain-containing protein [Longimicrobiaceae bacterium]